jgi:hypothetical protein
MCVFFKPEPNFLLAGMTTQRGEVPGRILLGDNRQRGGHAAKYQFVVC